MSRDLSDGLAGATGFWEYPIPKAPATLTADVVPLLFQGWAGLLPERHPSVSTYGRRNISPDIPWRGATVAWGRGDSGKPMAETADG
jgi:hypothetical protein